MSHNTQEAENKANAAEIMAKQARADSDKKQADEAEQKARASQTEADKAKA